MKPNLFNASAVCIGNHIHYKVFLLSLEIRCALCLFMNLGINVIAANHPCPCCSLAHYNCLWLQAQMNSLCMLSFCGKWLNPLLFFLFSFFHSSLQPPPLCWLSLLSAFSLSLFNLSACLPSSDTDYPSITGVCHKGKRPLLHSRESPHPPTPPPPPPPVFCSLQQTSFFLSENFSLLLLSWLSFFTSRVFICCSFGELDSLDREVCCQSFPLRLSPPKKARLILICSSVVSQYSICWLDGTQMEAWVMLTLVRNAALIGSFVLLLNAIACLFWWPCMYVSHFRWWSLPGTTTSSTPGARTNCALSAAVATLGTCLVSDTDTLYHILNKIATQFRPETKACPWQKIRHGRIYQNSGSGHIIW